MRTILRIIGPLVLTVLTLTSFTALSFAQEITIPDPGLNAVIRNALQKPDGPLTEQDVGSLTNLDACCLHIRDLTGLEAAHNLSVINLQSNQLSNLSLPSGLTNLRTVDLSFNPLTNCFFPDALTNLTRVSIKSSQLTNLVLPAALTALLELDLGDNRFTSFNLPSNLMGLGVLDLTSNQLTSFTFPANLTELDNLEFANNRLTSFSLPPELTNVFFLDLGFNALTNCVLPDGLTHLSTLFMAGNQLETLNLPAGLTSLVELDIWGNRLSSLALPRDATNLGVLSLFFNQLTNLTFPATVKRLATLDLEGNQFTSLQLPAGMTSLSFLDLDSNHLGHFTVPADMTNLNFLFIGQNQLTNIVLAASLNKLGFIALHQNQLSSLFLPPGLTNLTELFLQANRLTSISLPPDLNRLIQIDLTGNRLTALELPIGLINLSTLVLVGNQLTNLTLPPDMTRLATPLMEGNPLVTYVLSEPLAATMSDLIASLRNQGVSVFAYPLAVSLVSPQRTTAGPFEFTLTGPPGVYTICSSTNLTDGTPFGEVTNRVGSAVFVDSVPNLSSQRFYRAVLQGAPSDMVFILPNTFTMGSAVDEQDRENDEGPQTTVILSRGFWIGKFEVTQKEYLSVMNTNPSVFPGDLNRPVTSVSWEDATNYCWRLTQREFSAGRISAGCNYRLPTEAEWECAIRAGTTTRFSYGDDPTYSSIGDHAWFASNGSLMPHPVGQKLPNPWGLYDMEGNAVEWCQDWFDLLPGGVQTDPTGPTSSASGRKVTRGGAYDNTQQSCRSASRSLFPAGPFGTDTDLGFRVVLATKP